MVDIYEEITNRIIAEMEKGEIPWQKPWMGVSSGAISHSSGKPYSFLNQMLLGSPGEYITFKQCSEEGGRVKKGSKAKFVVFWKFLDKTKQDADGNPVFDENRVPVIDSIPYLRFFQVFHISECDGIKPKVVEKPLTDLQPDQKAESVIVDYVSRSGVTLIHEKQDRAFYRPSEDKIVMPIRGQFSEVAEYYGTLFHEATHSTGHQSRLNRLEPNATLAAFGSEGYSKEELVAEIGSAAILHEMKLETDRSFKNNAAYIQNWLKVLKEDKKFIVSAASRAEKAVNLILNIQAVRAA